MSTLTAIPSGVDSLSGMSMEMNSGGFEGGDIGSPLHDGVKDNQWRRYGEARREALLKEDREIGNMTFQLNRKFAVERYFEVADRVLHQFQTASDEKEALEATYIMGHRLLKFLATLAAHPGYNSDRVVVVQWREKAEDVLEDIEDSLDDIALLIDEEELNKEMRKEETCTGPQPEPHSGSEDFASTWDDEFAMLARESVSRNAPEKLNQDFLVVSDSKWESVFQDSPFRENNESLESTPPEDSDVETSIQHNSEESGAVEESCPSFVAAEESCPSPTSYLDSIDEDDFPDDERSLAGSVDKHEEAVVLQKNNELKELKVPEPCLPPSPTSVSAAFMVEEEPQSSADSSTQYEDTDDIFEFDDQEQVLVDSTDASTKSDDSDASYEDSEASYEETRSLEDIPESEEEEEEEEDEGGEEEKGEVEAPASSIEPSKSYESEPVYTSFRLSHSSTEDSEDSDNMEQERGNVSIGDQFFFTIKESILEETSASHENPEGRDSYSPKPLNKKAADARYFLDATKNSHSNTRSGKINGALIQKYLKQKKGDDSNHSVVSNERSEATLENADEASEKTKNECDNEERERPTGMEPRMNRLTSLPSSTSPENRTRGASALLRRSARSRTPTERKKIAECIAKVRDWNSEEQKKSTESESSKDRQARLSTARSTTPSSRTRVSSEGLRGRAARSRTPTERKLLAECSSSAENRSRNASALLRESARSRTPTERRKMAECIAKVKDLSSNKTITRATKTTTRTPSPTSVDTDKSSWKRELATSIVTKRRKAIEAAAKSREANSSTLNALGELSSKLANRPQTSAGETANSAVKTSGSMAYQTPPRNASLGRRGTPVKKSPSTPPIPTPPRSGGNSSISKKHASESPLRRQTGENPSAPNRADTSASKIDGSSPSRLSIAERRKRLMAARGRR